MQFKQKLVYIALGCMILLIGVVLLINAMAQAPEKAQIAFHSDRDGNKEIYIMDADGKNQRKLTNNPAVDKDPAWSPDGQRIAFHAYNLVPRVKDDIYVMDADGNNRRKLTNNPASDMWPAWSPDGQKIAFHSDRDGNDEIYVMDADGKNQRRLTIGMGVAQANQQVAHYLIQLSKSD